MKKILPLSLTFTVVLMDQLAKILILSTLPRRGIGVSFFGDFFQGNQNAICLLRSTHPSASMYGIS